MPAELTALRVFAVAIAVLLFFAREARAAPAIPPQAATCQPSWVPTFGGFAGVAGDVDALKVFDDGSGPALYVGGHFSNAGGVPAAEIAKWDGASWSPLGSGMTAMSFASPVVQALEVFDDGGGPALFAGGGFTSAGGVVVNHIAKWNGSSWSSLGVGVGNNVRALQVFDDGLGPRLFVGGGFTTGGSNAHYIAAWDGANWSPISGLPSAVFSLAVFDDGAGAALYAGTTSGVYKLFGTLWAPVGFGLGGNVNALAVFDDGSGPSLYAGGEFPLHAAKWNGSSWIGLGGGVSGNVKALTVFNDGQSRALFAGGEFTQVGATPVAKIARWDGASWSAVGAGVGGTGLTWVSALAGFNDGHGRCLYVGGTFSIAGTTPSTGIAKWDGSAWSSLGRTGFDSLVTALTVFDDGTGPMLIAGGAFTTTGQVAAKAIARWNGAKWSALGTGFGFVGANPWVRALAVFDDGNGPALYAGGMFSTAGGVAAINIAKWNGSVWSPLGSGIGGQVLALCVFDDGSGPALYAAGQVLSAGGIPVNHIAKWNGSNWSALSSGLSAAPLEWTRALAVFDDGSGPALYAGGDFTTAGAVTAQHIAKWNGSSWSGLGSPMTGANLPTVSSLAVFDDGSGTALYVGGTFDTVAGVSVRSIARWNGTMWSALGSGLSNSPATNAGTHALAVFDDGTGARLFATGDFMVAGGVSASGIASWNGVSWAAVGQGLAHASGLSFGGAFATYDDSSGPALFVGGFFPAALDSGDSCLAKWGCAFVASGTVYCTSSTTTNGCTPSISASGSASASNGSGLAISVGNLESHRLGLVFYGIHGQLASPWGATGSSLLCVKAPLQRMHAYDSGGTPGLCNGLITEDWNLFIATYASALGQPFLGGETVWAQGWFRDPPAPKTTGLSNGLVFAVAP